MLYETIHIQHSKIHEIAYFLVCTQLRNVWDTSMVWNEFMNPVIVKDGGHSKESPVLDLFAQACPIKGFMGQRLYLPQGKYRAKISTTGEWLI